METPPSEGNISCTPKHNKNKIPQTVSSMIGGLWEKTAKGVKDGSQASWQYFMDAPVDDHRSVLGKVRDSTIAVALNPTVHFNLANIWFNIANGNLLAAKGFGAFTAVSAATSALDSWKNRASSSSYLFNAGVQGAGGATYIAMLPVDTANAVKGLALYSVATAAHSLRAFEELKAFKAKIPIDEYQKSYGTAATYSGTYYSLSELIAINAHEPSVLISTIAGLSVFRAFNDQKAWDMHPGNEPRSVKDKLKFAAASATAPRLAALAYGGAGTAAALSGDTSYAMAFFEWGFGNANLDLIRPKVEKLIKHIYANDPEQARQAMENFNALNVQALKQKTEDIRQETLVLTSLIRGAQETDNWDEAAREAIRLLDHSEDDPSKQILYTDVLREMSAGSHLARKKLKQMGVEWEDTRSEAVLGDIKTETREFAPAL